MVQKKNIYLYMYIYNLSKYNFAILKCWKNSTHSISEFIEFGIQLNSVLNKLKVFQLENFMFEWIQIFYFFLRVYKSKASEKLEGDLFFP